MLVFWLLNLLLSAVKYLLCYAHSVYSVLYVPTPVPFFSLTVC
jgi:hypothetical protein